jgi:hypothetical protein
VGLRGGAVELDWSQLGRFEAEVHGRTFKAGQKMLQPGTASLPRKEFGGIRVLRKGGLHGKIFLAEPMPSMAMMH